MEKRFYVSTNWAPWLAVGFVLSTVFFGIVSNGWLLLLLIILSFLPVLVVAVALRGYFILENNQIKFCYDRRMGRSTDYAISLVDVTRLEQVGKSVVISFDRGDEITARIHDAAAFVHEIVQQNPRIECVKNA